MSAFAQRVLEAWERLGLDATGGPVVVGVSGGVDSVVLVRTLVGLHIDVQVAHVDHGLRPTSADDAAWVERLAAEIGVAAHVFRVEVAVGNVQAEAREARYRALGALAAHVGSRTVAVAHTATDQAETLLLHLTRGTGVRGLAGMAPTRPLGEDGVVLVRPLLGVSRREIEAEARAQGWAWREDPTNKTDRYRRNRIRHRVLPLLEAEGGPETVHRIARAAGAVRQSLAVGGPEALFRRCAVADAQGGTVWLSAEVQALGDARAGLWLEALRRWTPDAPRSAAVASEIDRLVEQEVGARVELPGVAVWREAGAVRFVTERVPQEVIPVVLDGAGTARVETEAGVLQVTLGSAPGSLSPDPTEETVDARVLDGGATVRPWQAGDRLRPLGLRGSKLVSDLLRERGVPPSEKARQRVLCGGDGKIIWVIGHRLAAHAAVSPETRQAARLRWTPAPIARAGGAE